MANSPPKSQTALAPDPVEQPSEYRDLLLGLLGDDDPASVQRATISQLRGLVFGDWLALELRTPPDEGEWSMMQLLGHFADSELVVGTRYRWIVAHDTPALAPYDQDLWVDRLRHQQAGPTELLDLFAALRRANLAMWERIPPEERSRYGVHAERGDESYETTFRIQAGHDRFHLDQARRTVDAVIAKRDQAG
ncbi:MAG TPA: DinB family protein [Actinomycetota bacterium]|jgi:hypothetical protein